MATDKSTNEARVIVLESEMTHVKNAIDDLRETLEHNTEMTFHIKERLDKQNGAIPSIQENMKILLSEHRDLAKQVSDQATNQAKISVKTTILWAIVGVIGTGIAGYLMNIILGK